MNPILKKLLELDIPKSTMDTLFVIVHNQDQLLKLLENGHLTYDMIDELMALYKEHLTYTDFDVMRIGMTDGMRSLNLLDRAGYELLVKGTIGTESKKEVLAYMLGQILKGKAIAFNKVIQLKGIVILTSRGLEPLKVLITEHLDDNYLVPVRTMYLADEINELPLEAIRHIKHKEPTGTTTVAVDPNESKEIVDDILNRMMSK